MPQAIAMALVQYAGMTAVAANVAAAIIVVAATYAYGQTQQRRNERKAREAYNASLTDRQLVIRSAVAPARRVYGRDRVGGQLVFAHVSGAKGEFLHIVVCHAYHRCDAFEALYLNETLLPEPNAGGMITSGDYVKRIVHAETVQPTSDGAGTITLAHPTSSMPVVSVPTASEGYQQVSFTHTIGTTLISGLTAATAHMITYTWEESKPLVRVRRYLGTQTAADPDLVAETGGKWTTAHIGQGRTYTAWRFEYDHDIFGAVGLPNISAVLRGALLFDPRTSTTAYSDNVALVVADWLKHGDGLAQSSAQVPDAEIIAAANICDELVPVADVYGATQRWNFNNGPDGWAAAGGGLTYSHNVIRIGSTGSDPQLIGPAVSFAGLQNRYVRAKVRRIAGSGWEGALFYETGAHSYSYSFHKIASQPAFAIGQWYIIEWDMHALTAGGNDWRDNTITRIRFDLGSSIDDGFEIAWIAVGGDAAQKRYTFNGSFTYDIPPKEWLADMTMAMAGACVFVQGRWLIRPGAYRNPGITIDASSLAGSMQVQPKAARAQLFHAVRATYRDPSSDYVEVQAPVVSNSQYALEDGAPLPPRDIQLPFLADTHRAQRLAKIELERSRQAMTVSLTTNLRAYNLAPTDTVMLDFPAWFGSPKAFEVVERSYKMGLEIDYTLREISASSFAWSMGQATVGDPAPDTTLPSVVAPAALVGLAAAATTTDAMALGSGSRLARIRVTWAAIADMAVTQGGFVEVEYSTGDRWIPAPVAAGGDTSTDIVPAPVGVVPIRARAVNAIGMRGEWRITSVVVSGSRTSIDTGTMAPESAAKVVSTIVDSHEIDISPGPGTAQLVTLGAASIGPFTVDSKVEVTLTAYRRLESTTGRTGTAGTVLAYHFVRLSMNGSFLLSFPAVADNINDQLFPLPAGNTQYLHSTSRTVDLPAGSTLAAESVWSLVQTTLAQDLKAVTKSLSMRLTGVKR